MNPTTRLLVLSTPYAPVFKSIMRKYPALNPYDAVRMAVGADKRKALAACVRKGYDNNDTVCRCGLHVSK